MKCESFVGRPTRRLPARAGGTHLVSSDSEDGASDGGEIPPHVSRIPDDEIDRAEALDARGGVFAATWRPCKGQPVAVALKAVDAVELRDLRGNPVDRQAIAVGQLTENP